MDFEPFWPVWAVFWHARLPSQGAADAPATQVTESRQRLHLTYLCSPSWSWSLAPCSAVDMPRGLQPFRQGARRQARPPTTAAGAAKLDATTGKLIGTFWPLFASWHDAVEPHQVGLQGPFFFINLYCVGSGGLITRFVAQYRRVPAEGPCTVLGRGSQLQPLVALSVVLPPNSPSFARKRLLVLRLLLETGAGDACLGGLRHVHDLLGLFLASPGANVSIFSGEGSAWTYAATGPFFISFSVY